MVSSFEKLSHEVDEVQVKLTQLCKEVLTRVTESYEKMAEPVMGVFTHLCDGACAVAEYGLDFLKAHEPEIKHVLTGVSGYVQGTTIKFY